MQNVFYKIAKSLFRPQRDSAKHFGFWLAGLSLLCQRKRIRKCGKVYGCCCYDFKHEYVRRLQSRDPNSCWSRQRVRQLYVHTIFVQIDQHRYRQSGCLGGCDLNLSDREKKETVFEASTTTATTISHAYVRNLRTDNEGKDERKHKHNPSFNYFLLRSIKVKL